MKNQFKYLEDTYLFEDQSVISLIGSDERGYYITLDHTIFYPQGGGQPTDTGFISQGDTDIPVNFVAFVDGEIRHYVNKSTFNNGDSVLLKVDKNKRIQNAKCHTAGHLIQAVIEGLPYGLRAVKGYHFSDGAYVEFVGTMPEDIQTLIDNANNLIQKTIEAAHPLKTKIVTYDELKTISKYPPEDLPKEKPLRIASIDGFDNAVPCGGTHLTNTNELKELKITKIKSKKGQIRVSYSFA